MPVHTHDFDQIAPQFLERANRMVWCSAATIDGSGRPRSRVLHPIWEGSTGWITTDPTSPKSHDLARNPWMSLAWTSDVAKPAFADCRAEWVNDPATKQHVWDLCKRTPEPLGFDPTPIYGSPDETTPGRPTFGVLRLVPYRITLTQWPEPILIWTPDDEDAWFAAAEARIAGVA